MQSIFKDSGKLKILLTGANGQLGREFQAIAPDWSALFEFYFAGRDELDISLESRLKKFIEENRPDVVINCAAYTNVEKAQDDQDMAYLVNGEAVGWLAEACAKNNCLLIHYSTDYVFDGNSDKPYLEDDIPAPLNIYGDSKWRGEKLIDEKMDHYFIFRVSWLYSTFGHNFFRTILRLAGEKENLRIVNDQIASPTYARLLAQHSLQIIEHFMANNVHQLGIYHYAESGEASWYDFANAIVSQSGNTIPVHPVSSAEFPTKAVRPAYSKLNTGKCEKNLGLKFPTWQESLAQCYRDMTSGQP